MKKKSHSPKNNIIFIIAVIILAVIALLIISRPPRKEIIPPKKIAVAFVIDDWGYNMNNIDLAFEINRPITLAVLPHLRYSKEIAERVGDNKLCDAILHLPLESKSGRTPERNTIRHGMKKDEILAILDKDIEDVPGIIGVSNHQGSRATEDKTVMKVILGELKRKNLFFLDSRTTPISVCPGLARNISLKYAERDVFLDLAEKKTQKQYSSYIKHKINELVKIAKKKGSAIAIGHDKKLTLEVIKESIPELEKQNIEIVPLRSLVRQYE